MSDWPALFYEDWSATCDTLHAHTQVLAKLAAVLGAPEPQLQHAALRLTARGWETLPLPAPDGSGAFAAALDLHTHKAVAEHSDGRVLRVALTPDRPVGEVTRELLAAVRSLAGDFEIDLTPQEVPWSVPLDTFYAYAHPAPDGFAGATLEPDAARWEAALGEYVLDWDDLRASPDPHAARRGHAVAHGGHGPRLAPVCAAVHHRPLVRVGRADHRRARLAARGAARRAAAEDPR